MILNYLKVAARHLLKNKLYLLINKEFAIILLIAGILGMQLKHIGHIEENNRNLK